MNDSTFTNLRNLLAVLIHDKQSIERIIGDAGIALKNLVLNSTPLNNWQEVLLEAIKAYQIYPLLSVLKNEYIENKELQNACDGLAQRIPTIVLLLLSHRPKETALESETLNSEKFAFSIVENKTTETKGNLNSPLSKNADIVKTWFFKELQSKEQSLLLATALFEGMSRQKLVEVMVDIERILSTDN